MSWMVYMVRCGNGALYTGITNDLARRLREHRTGRRGAKYTRGRGFLSVAWSKRVADRSAALREEARIKKLPKRDKERLVLQSNPLLQAFLEHCPSRAEIADNPGLMRKVVEMRDDLVAKYSWGVPTESALREIAALSPVVEMGAGTGYWSALLRRMGAEAVAFDRSPPGSLRSLVAACNPWHVDARRHCRVKVGTPVDLKMHGDKTLLLCWPPRGTMARQCLRHWTGTYLVYVGELDGGMTADREFFEELRSSFDMAGLVQIPQWPGVSDVMTVWRRRPLP